MNSNTIEHQEIASPKEISCSWGRAYSDQTKENMKRVAAIVTAFQPIGTVGVSAKMPMVSYRTTSTYLRKLRDGGEVVQGSKGLWRPVINRMFPNEDWWLEEMPGAGEERPKKKASTKRVPVLPKRLAEMPCDWTSTEQLANIWGVSRSTAYETASKLIARESVQKRKGGHKVEWKPIHSTGEEAE